MTMSPVPYPPPSPGVSSLRTLLAQNKDDDVPKLNILLIEALVAVEMSLLVHALTMYDANILFRLVGNTFQEQMWSRLFGGGIRKLIKIQPPVEPATSK